MLEALLAFALAVGLIRAVRLRHAWAIAGGCAVMYLLIADLSCAVAARDQGGVFGFFSLAFIGPGAMPMRSAGALPIPHVLVAHPLVARGARSFACWVVAFLCYRQSSRFNPLLPRAYALDDLASAYAGAGIVDALAAIVLLWAWLMLGDDAVLVPRE